MAKAKGDVVGWRPVATVRKFDDSGHVYETITCKGNLLTTAGMDRILSRLVTTAAVEPMDANSVRVGVGDDDTTAMAADVDLSQTTNQWYQVLDPGFPTVDVNSATYRATFGVDDANFSWACWGLDVNDAWDESPGMASSATPVELFNRKVFNFGTKDGGTWDLTVIISFEG